MTGTPDAPLHVAAPVAAALEAGRPVVALESTIISHGLPRPRNLDVAVELERRLRAAGVLPATIGVIDGVPTVGLDAAQLELLATDPGVLKASVRDLPPAMATGRHAGTTVAATALLAGAAGIEVFATGGLGGVHREASVTFDESADLQTLARVPITVVAAGVKSILDVPATLERLETLSIGVVGYRTDTFPGFYVTDSGHRLDWRIDDPRTLAAAVRARGRLGLPGALLVANPVPADRQLDPRLHEAVLAAALRAAADAGVTGKQTTPFLLDHIQRGTGGRSLAANIAAVRHNVDVAADLARALSAGPTA